MSRTINRPLSSAVTKLLLPLPITPNAFTFLITPFPVIGAMLVARGGYLTIVLGTLLYQIYSILDGCDGEIARAKNLQSRMGERLDKWCDTGASALLCVGVAIGVSVRQPALYFTEGTVGALLIVLNEVWLERRTTAHPEKAAARSETYPRHRVLLANPVLPLLGDRALSILIQMTKRDVAILFFVFLAAVGQPVWIMHLLFTTAFVTSILAVSSLRRSKRSTR